MDKNLLSLLQGQLGEGIMNQLAQQVGGNQQNVSSAVNALLPTILGGIVKNASTQEGANSLANALDRDHDGGILDDLMGFVSNNGQQGKQFDGAGILKHVLGDNRAVVEQAVAQNSGLQSNQVGGLMNTLAPMVMSLLGQQKKQSGLDVGGLMNMLMGQKDQVKQQIPSQFGMLSKFIDMDGDGDIKDDLMNMGSKFLGNLFKK